MSYDTPEQNIFAKHGDDDAYAIIVDEPVLDGNGKPVLDANGDPTYQRIDITGWKFFLTVKLHKTDPDDKAIIGPLRFTMHDNAEEGETHVAWSAEDSTQKTGSYYYDLQYVDAAGKVKTFMQGRFVITHDITGTTT